MIKSFVFVGNTRVGTAITENLRAASFKVASGIEDADAILVYADSQTELEDIFFDSKGLVQTAKKNTYFIILSASTPNFARELNALSIVSDLHAIEAPLIVLDTTIEKAFSDHANLDCFVAGEEADIESITPLLNALAATVRITGIPGSAQLAHAVLAIQRSARLVACMETEALYRAFSSSSDAAFRSAYEQGFMTGNDLRLVEAIKEERFKGDYTIQMWMADLSAALMSADDNDLILPGAESCMHLLELLAVIGGASLNPAALSMVYGEETLCAKHGLDWTRAEQAYQDDEHECDDDDCDHNHNQGEFPGGFGSYSAN